MRVQDLAPLILEILTSPNTDLSTVSAKSVRKQLVELRSNVTADFVKENKAELNALITKIFRSLENTVLGSTNNDASYVDSQDVAPNSAVNGKRKRREEMEREEDSERDNIYGDDGEPSQSPVPSASKKAKKASHKLTDEEYARQLSSELNQRPSRSNRKSNGSPTKSFKRTPKKTKSRAKVEESDDDSGDSDSRVKQRKSRKNNGEAKGGFAKELVLSEPLAAVVDATQLSRPQVVKKLWVYIKANDLQNPKNKKEILCDDLLRAIFNADKIDMFTMNKVLSQHLYEVE